MTEVLLVFIVYLYLFGAKIFLRYCVVGDGMFKVCVTQTLSFLFFESLGAASVCVYSIIDSPFNCDSDDDDSADNDVDYRDNERSVFCCPTTCIVYVLR